MSQRALSLAAGLSQSHVGQIIRGQIKGAVAPDVIEALAEAGKVDLTWLLTGRGEPRPETHVVPLYDEALTRVDKAIALVFNAPPPVELDTRIREKLRKVGFSDGGSLHMLISVIEEEKAAWARENDGMPPKSPEAPRTEVQVREGATRRKPIRRK